MKGSNKNKEPLLRPKAGYVQHTNSIHNSNVYIDIRNKAGSFSPTKSYGTL